MPIINKDNVKNFSAEKKESEKYVWKLPKYLQNQYLFGVDMKMYINWKSQNT